MNDSPITVIKVGGGEGNDAEAIAHEAAALVRTGERIVLVHGGSHETNQLARALGHPPQFIRSPSGHTSRRTDRQTLEIFEMAYCGKVNKQLVEILNAQGVRAIGLSGLDGPIWRASRKTAIREQLDDGRTRIIRDDLSGRVTDVDGAFLQVLLDRGLTPVLTPPAWAEDGVAVNVDADRAAAATAGALDARTLLLLSNVPGLLRDPEDPESRFTTVDAESIGDARSAAGGRMKNKVLAAEEALRAGVGQVVIGPARGPGSIEDARSGRTGTRFMEGAVA